MSIPTTLWYGWISLPTLGEIKKIIIEPRNEKNRFSHICAKTKPQISCAFTVHLISTFVFAR